MKTMRKPLSVLMAICLLVALLPVAAAPALATVVVEVRSWDELKTAFENASTSNSSPTRISLADDVYNNTDDTAPVTLPTGHYAILDLNDHYILQKEISNKTPNHQNVITVSGNLTLTDTTAAASRTTRYLRLYSSSYNYVQEVYTTEPSDTANCFSVSGGFIAGGYSSNTAGGGVRVEGNGSSLTMEGGTICGNAVSPSNFGSGGGVCVDGGSFTLKEAENVVAPLICNNEAKYGGGVYLRSGSFTMSGGAVNNNKASVTGSQGGGVYVKNGSFTMEGGTIGSNTADNGGGVYVEAGTFDVKKTSVIELNTATYGGGVTVAGGTCSMDSRTAAPEVRCNTATDGGGFYIAGGTLDLVRAGSYGAGKTIRNTATNGGGIYLYSGVCKECRGYISENHATSEGGGIYVYGGTLYYHNFSNRKSEGIWRNTKGTDAPSGIYLKGDNVITLGMANAGTDGLGEDVLVAKEGNSGVVAQALSNHNSGVISEFEATHFRSENVGYHVILNADKKAELIPTDIIGGISYLLDATNETASVVGYAGSAPALVIPAEVTKTGVTYDVTSIADKAFKGNTTITSATIADSVTSWGYYAFSGCTNLATVVLPDGLTTITIYTFKDCTSLSGVIIPASVTAVQGSAFLYVPGPVYALWSLSGSNLPSGSGATVRYGAVATSTETAGCTFTLDGTSTTPDALAAKGYFVVGDTVTVTPSSGFTITAASIQGDDSITVTVAQDGSSASFTMPSGKDATVLVTVDESSSQAPTSGNCGAEGDGSNLTWSLDVSTGALTITGSGAMEDFATDTVPWKESKASIQSIIVEDGVTTIGENAFNGCTAATTITLGGDIETIKYGAFRDCSSVQQLILPPSVTTIDPPPPFYNVPGDNTYANYSLQSSGLLPQGTHLYAAVTVTGTSSDKLTLTGTDKTPKALADMACFVAGDTVTVTAAEGYELGDFTVSDGTDNIAVSNNSFTMPDPLTADVTITATVTVAAVPVESVTMNKSTLDLTVGGSETLTATVMPYNATDKTVTWSSDNVAVATVTDAGAVKAVGTGTATITATAGEKSDVCVVTVASESSQSGENGSQNNENGDQGGDIYVPTPSDSGSSNKTDTKTETLDDGSTVTTTENADGSKTVVTEAPDGTKTTEETDADGKVTAKTVESPDGTKATEQANADGGKTAVTETPDGTRTTEETDADGKVVSVKTELGEEAVESAADSGEPVKLPVAEVPAADSAEDALPVQVTLPEGAGEVKVEIPVENAGPGTVAAIVNADGSLEILPSTAGEDGLVVTLSESAELVVFDNAMTFDDVPPDAWYADVVAWVTARGIMQGTDRGFEPDMPTSRAMLIRMVWNMAGKPGHNGAAPFTDVAPDAWYADAIAWAYEAGLVRGNGDGTFGSGEDLSREQAAVILYNFARFLGLDVSARGDLDGFPDSDRVSDWAGEAMAWAVGAGIIEGNVDSDGNVILDAGSGATRAQIAAMFQRFCEKVVK